MFDKNDIFIVTGASSGIGEAIALELNANGATVVGIGRSTTRLLNAKNKAMNKESFYIETKDLTENVEDLPNYIRELKNKYGKFKGLACVAGIDKVMTTQMLNKEDIDNIFLINYTVPMLLTKGFVDKRNNVGEGANILFLASISGTCPEKGQIVYGASKAAIIAASSAISKEMALKGIRCNCISPAWVDTPMFERQKELTGVSTEHYPLGIGKTEDIANLAIYLMSDKSRWITGENFKLSGGI